MKACDEQPNWYRNRKGGFRINCIAMGSWELSMMSQNVVRLFVIQVKSLKCQKISWRNVILLLKLFWPTVRKNFANSRPSASNFKSFSRSLEQFIQIVKGQNNFWWQNAFLTCYWSFLICNKTEQLYFKLEKNIGI